MREYLSVPETGKIIASEVVETGSSKNWSRVNNNNLALAKDLEKHLAKFNIGYTDPRNGSWSTKRDGTRYFSTMSLVGLAKGRVETFLASFKK